MLTKDKLPFNILFLVSVVLPILFVITAILIHVENKAFQDSSGVPISNVINQIITGFGQPPVMTHQENTIVFLILGTNEVPGRPVPPITDTMLIASVNTKTGQIGLFSVPRDIWSDPYKTKIDALYTYGLVQYPGKPEQFPDEVLTQMTGVFFDRTVVITPEEFIATIDTLGGIDINVAHPFIDNLYPKMDVDVTKVTDPKLLYETVEFKAGWQHMDGERALEYVRSRHSTGTEGSDIARSQRQREVISILASKFKDPKFYLDIGRLGKLYKLYNQYFSQYLTTSDLVSILKQIYPIRNKIKITGGSPSVSIDNLTGSIFHPNYSPLNDGQWVFLLKDDAGLQKEVKTTLGLPNK